MKNKLLLAIGIGISGLTVAHAELPMSEAQFKREMLSAHNQFRAKHQAEELQWDQVLADYATKYASACRFKHSGSPYGENLGAGYLTPSASVTAWCNEVAQYSYAKPGFSMKTGHFTQLVWASSKKLGCGYYYCDGEHGTPGMYIVCEYSPRGNIVGADYFEHNVFPITTI